MLSPSEIEVSGFPFAADGVVTTFASQTSNVPPAKSLSVAFTDVEDRVSAMKLEKHSSSRWRKARSMPPS